MLRRGATEADPYTLLGQIVLSFPSGWEHQSYALAVHPTDVPGSYEVFFNVGSEANFAATPVSGVRLPPDPLRDARLCYDHLAGRLGIAVTDALLRRRHLIPQKDSFAVTDALGRVTQESDPDGAANRPR